MNLENISFECDYQVNGERCFTTTHKTDHFTLDLCVEENSLSFSISPKVPVEIIRFAVKLPYLFHPDDHIFVNGYQSWTDSLEYRPGDQMRELTPLTEYLVAKSPLKHVGFSKSGDLQFHPYPRKPGASTAYRVYNLV